MTEIDVMLQLVTTIANMQESQKLLIDCVRTTNERISVLRETVDLLQQKVDVIENIQTYDACTEIQELRERRGDVHSMAQKIRQRQND